MCKYQKFAAVEIWEYLCVTHGIKKYLEKIYSIFFVTESVKFSEMVIVNIILEY